MEQLSRSRSDQVPVDKQKRRTTLLFTFYKPLKINEPIITLNQRVWGSSPHSPTIFQPFDKTIERTQF